MLSLRAPSTLSTKALPGRCQVCGRWPAQPVCDPCLAHWGPVQPRCPVCAVTRLPGAPAVCGACLTQPQASPVSGCAAAVDYAYPWDRLIGRWKFGHETGWSRLWAQLLWRDPHARDLWLNASHITAVPVTAGRLAQRGFNQAWELTKALQQQADGRGGVALPEALVLLRERPDQHSLPREQRLRNLQGAFAPHPGAASTWRGGHVLVVDDVRTTGATLHAAAQCLLDSGARRVSALILARTPPVA